jgi:uncharacterized protein (DUF433 family)
MSARTFCRGFGYNDCVRIKRPARSARQDLRDLPMYSIPEAAASLAVPSRTMHEWFAGRRRIFTPAGQYATHSLLSFRDLAEAYMLYVLREYHGFSFMQLRRVLVELQKESRSRHPLLTSDVKIFAERYLVLDRPPRGGHPREVVNLSKSRQLAIPDVVDVFSKRILRDDKGQPYAIYPWRFFNTDNESRPVEIDPEVMSGSLVVSGSRIPVRILLAMRLAGKSPDSIAKNYRLDLDTVQKALLHVDEDSIQKVA